MALPRAKAGMAVVVILAIQGSGRRLQGLHPVAGIAGRSTPLSPRVASAWRRPLSGASSCTGAGR
ncbi:hypothetical protein, partial [Xanthomonas euvesicatoria]|uniref:hypothetical protein n=1 Tax=Xanthomonas euvesicatoria TaxID=456327 RepID=UPI001E5DBADB